MSLGVATVLFLGVAVLVALGILFVVAAPRLRAGDEDDIDARTGRTVENPRHTSRTSR